ncbi:MAG: glycoside hydrolase family 2 TIM barrel-domain containing protein [Clostridia bacterium]
MREKYLLNEGWKFHLGDISEPIVIGHYPTAMHSKAKNGLGAAAASFYDKDFVDVRIPHDYVLEGEVNSKFNGSAGSYKRETAWYRRHFKLPCEIGGKRIIVNFDGAGKNSKVWCNGFFAGENKSIYNSFYIDITPYLLDDETNTISVRIENDEVEGWWYEGAGIYRDVWLTITDEIAVDMWGTYVNPKLLDNANWDVAIETTIWNNIANSANVLVKQTVYDANGDEVKSVSNKTTVEYGETLFNQNLTVNKPKLWDTENCNLYNLKTEIFCEDVKKDEYDTSFGFRTISYDADTGFYLNGKSIKQRGLCYHQDHANQGVAMSHSLYEFRIQNMKRMGVNAYRFAHNPSAPGVLDLCDQYGIMVMEENRWFNWSEKSQKELKTMLKCARNHPSVVIWSVGNEEPVQSTKTGGRLVDSLTKLVKKYDETRPVTVALNGGYFDSYSAESSEVVGVNYNVQLYDKMRIRHKTKPIVASETAACSGTRGIYFEPDGSNSGYCSDFDRVFGFANAKSCADTIRGMEVNPFICGTYMWTGQDYRGEAAWPGLIASCGVTDACGFFKDKTYLVKALWNKEDMVHVFPHWSLQGHEGEKLTLYTYSNGDQVELVVNGKSLGIKDYHKYEPASWDVVYEPGYIEAIAYRNGKIIAKDKSVTTSSATKMLIESQLDNITNTGEDIAIFKISLQDKDGNFIPTATDTIIPEILDVENGEILSVSNSDPVDHAHAKSLNMKMFGGLVQVLVRVKEGAKTVGIKAKSKENKLSAQLTIDVADVQKFLRLDGGDRDMSIDSFKIWPKCNGFEDITKEYNFDDMNSNEFISFANYKPENQEGYLLFTAKTVFPESDRTMNMCFKGIQGEFEFLVYHDHQAWPNPSPKEFLTIEKHEYFSEKINYEIPLDGFGSNQKIKIVMICKNNNDFNLNNVEFELIKGV